MKKLTLWFGGPYNALVVFEGVLPFDPNVVLIIIFDVILLDCLAFFGADLLFSPNEINGAELL